MLCQDRVGTIIFFYLAYRRSSSTFAQLLLGTHMLRWRLLGEHTLCRTRDDSADIVTGPLKNPHDCPKLCLTTPGCEFATYWGSSSKYCSLYRLSKCNNPIRDTSFKAMSWKRHHANQGLPDATASFAKYRPATEYNKTHVFGLHSC